MESHRLHDHTESRPLHIDIDSHLFSYSKSCDSYSQDDVFNYLSTDSLNPSTTKYRVWCEGGCTTHKNRTICFPFFSRFDTFLLYYGCISTLVLLLLLYLMLARNVKYPDYTHGQEIILGFKFFPQYFFKPNSQ